MCLATPGSSTTGPPEALLTAPGCHVRAQNGADLWRLPSLGDHSGSLAAESAGHKAKSGAPRRMPFQLILLD